jgi:hypothetical protein
MVLTNKHYVHKKIGADQSWGKLSAIWFQAFIFCLLSKIKQKE